MTVEGRGLGGGNWVQGECVCLESLRSGNPEYGCEGVFFLRVTALSERIWVPWAPVAGAFRMLNLVACSGIGDEIWPQHRQVVNLSARILESSSNLSPSLSFLSAVKDE